MSRSLEMKVLPNGKALYREEVISMDECKWLYDGVCCNADCELCADFPMGDECKVCTCFEQEDGKVSGFVSEDKDAPE